MVAISATLRLEFWSCNPLLLVLRMILDYRRNLICPQHIDHYDDDKTKKKDQDEETGVFRNRPSIAC